MSREFYDMNYYRKHKKYSDDQMANLFISFYAGDSCAREKIIIGNLYVITLVIKRTIFDFSKIGFEDLFSVGEIGLLRAVDSYDINSNVLFSTYAYTCIRNEIIYYLRGKHNYEALTLQDDYEYEYTHNIGYRNSNFLEFIEDEDYIEDVCDDRDLLNKYMKQLKV